jgi:hypothetical protein
MDEVRWVSFVSGEVGWGGVGKRGPVGGLGQAYGDNLKGAFAGGKWFKNIRCANVTTLNPYILVRPVRRGECLVYGILIPPFHSTWADSTL